SRSQVSSRSLVDGDEISKDESVKEKTQKVATNMKRRTIFEMLIQIVREEGFFGLYQGLEGEVLKGFFAHGLTMLLKERIHKVVIRLYYLILRLLRRYPGPEETAKAAVAVGKKATKRARNVGIQGQEMVEEVVGAMHDLYQYAKESHM